MQYEKIVFTAPQFQKSGHSIGSLLPCLVHDKLFYRRICGFQIQNLCPDWGCSFFILFCSYAIVLVSTIVSCLRKFLSILVFVLQYGGNEFRHDNRSRSYAYCLGFNCFFKEQDRRRVYNEDKRTILCLGNAGRICDYSPVDAACIRL